MNRREFIKLSAIYALTVASDNHAAPHHPFSALLDIKTGHHYQPKENKYQLALLMTAQQSQPNCGASFIGLHQLFSALQRQGLSSDVEPILIMPKPADQSQGKADVLNLTRATKTYAHLDFTILTGSVSHLVKAASDLGGKFIINTQNKIENHTLEAYFLSPSGNKLLKYPSTDGFSSIESVQNIIKKCDGWLAPAACK
ncbi:MAG: hypothetical protein CL570_01620 [Alphaproteobacteria bacterium]|nr:hypothetical protein [Alphaproteobacteria bacterium]HCQ70750.1 hypothetical protein [Rhodospirillaceae bacterium]|tara:strand:+ start:31050 stop:31646 length:597 start_codon:yes stop_codon:yes gene_type:complete